MVEGNAAMGCDTTRLANWLDDPRLRQALSRPSQAQHTRPMLQTHSSIIYFPFFSFFPLLSRRAWIKDAA